MIEQTSANPIEAVPGTGFDLSWDQMSGSERAAYDAGVVAGRLQATTRTPVMIPGGVLELHGDLYWRAADGSLTPAELVKPFDQLMDAEVRKIMGFAIPLSDEVGRFRRHTLDDVANLLSLMAQEYGVKRGGKKGNVTLNSYDGTLKVTLRIADRIMFGPELKAAKDLVDEYLTEKATGLDADIRRIIQHAFHTDQEGLVNRAELFRLLRLDIKDDRWQRAMQAIQDSIRIIGSKEYVRFERRADHRSPWTTVTIDVAAS